MEAHSASCFGRSLCCVPRQDVAPRPGPTLEVRPFCDGFGGVVGRQECWLSLALVCCEPVLARDMPGLRPLGELDPLEGLGRLAGY